jgi:hypothetical protein
LVLRAERHPGDPKYYHPIYIAVACGMVHLKLPKISTYPANPFGPDPSLPDELLHCAEAALKIAASWIKIAGKALFASKENNDTKSLHQWFFWTKRFEEIAESGYASEDVRRLAIECAGHMNGMAFAPFMEAQPLNNNNEDGICMEEFWEPIFGPSLNSHTSTINI